MDTAFVIGNGESRKIFPIEHIKGHGTIYGCNAIYRDHPWLCDHIVAVNEPMYDEVMAWWRDRKPDGLKVHGINDISKWDYVCDGDSEHDVPNRLKLYRVWRGGDKKSGKIKTNDFTKAKGSGCSAVLMAAESGVKNVILLGFDILGARQWEYTGARAGEQSRLQNNIYKNTPNYPDRHSMKAYLKFEWMFQLRQITKRFPDTDFYFVNRREYISGNKFLKYYFDQPNIKVGIYASLKKWIEGDREPGNWIKLKT